MSDHRNQATRLTSALQLSVPPVAVAFPESVPPEVPGFDGTVPAGCSFWQEAITKTFATTAEDHGLCSIGIHTHGFAEAPASQPEELKTALEAMIGLDYVSEAEVGAIPVIRRPVRNAVYGPLAEFPLEPELVLLFTHSRQGLVVTEAVERVDGATAPAMGRPACAVVPLVLERGTAAMSLGCCGARAYLDKMSDDVSLWALPAAKLDGYCEQIDILARANQILSTFHERRKQDVDAGARPTVRESLARLQ